MLGYRCVNPLVMRGKGSRLLSGIRLSLRTQEGGDAPQPSLATSLRVVSAAAAAAAAAGLGQGRRAARHAAPIRTHLRRGRTARKTPGRRRTPGSRWAPQLRNASPPLVTHCSRLLISDCGRRRAARPPRRRHGTNKEVGRKKRLKDASREARASTSGDGTSVSSTRFSPKLTMLWELPGPVNRLHFDKLTPLSERGRDWSDEQVASTALSA
ncbi:hypothetical protein HPB47_007069 [Ixodes persulcatus]|uniref:Uncharacterized protein n=1 Tax=Ixodes persulcatus TaxID=34615 RepID=A0AC60P8H5_IXOPE|nr:hypothetical protein HPB47_007069 [Ixodes persulcatus]